MSGFSGGTASASSGLRQTFRGLHARTHPDSDAAKSKVMIVHADEIVFDDNYSLTSGIDRLVAALTGSGAGGLDTGAEGASRWYETYVIRKSTDGTLNALLHRCKDWTTDTSFTTARDASRALRRATSTATDKLAQGIQFASSKPFVYHDAELVRAGSVVGNIWFTLESDTAGSPSGSVLATSDKFDASVIATSNQIIRVLWRTPFTVTASTQYHLVLQGDYTRSDTVNIAWRGVVAGGYASGSGKEYNGTSWAAASGVGDFYFNAAVEQNNTAVSMPAGYDQKCLVCYAYNDSGSDLLPFRARDREVKRILQGSTNLGSITNTFGTLSDLSALVPPVPVTIFAGGYNTGNGFSIHLAPVPDGYGVTVAGWSAGSLIMLNPSGENTILAGFGQTQTEAQGAYQMVSGGTGIVHVIGFAW